MTTATLYESERYVFKVRTVMRRKHGRPVGHKRSWVHRDVIVTKAPAVS